jgi:DNA-binding MarR family transcriptional regulator
MTEKLDDTVFYVIEIAIKTYRQHAQRRITEAGYDITIDQWLVLKTLLDNPSATQQELAAAVFKDFASITRIIELLVTKEYLDRSPHETDRRRFKLSFTKSGLKIIESLKPIVQSYRKAALKGIPAEDILHLKTTLNRITLNTLP